MDNKRTFRRMFVCMLALFVLLVPNSTHDQADAVAPLAVAIAANPPLAMCAAAALVGAAAWGAYNCGQHGNVWGGFKDWMDGMHNALHPDNMKNAAEEALKSEGLLPEDYVRPGEGPFTTGDWVNDPENGKKYKLGSIKSQGFDWPYQKKPAFAPPNMSPPQSFHQYDGEDDRGRLIRTTYSIDGMQDMDPQQAMLDRVYDRATNPGNPNFNPTTAGKAMGDIGGHSGSSSAGGGTDVLTSGPPPNVAPEDIADMGTAEAVWGDVIVDEDGNLSIVKPEIRDAIKGLGVPEIESSPPTVVVPEQGKAVLADPGVVRPDDPRFPPGSMIRPTPNAPPGTITVVSPGFESTTTVFDPTVATYAASPSTYSDGSIPVANTGAGDAVIADAVVDEAELESEMENNFNPAIPGFDPSIAMPEKKDIPIADWVALVPFVGALQQSSVNLQNATSALSFEFDVMGNHVNATVDFSEFEHIFTAMGAVIFAIASFLALKIALIQR